MTTAAPGVVPRLSRVRGFGCPGCGHTWALALYRCPRCGWERGEGEDGMAKITESRGPTSVEAGPGEPGHMPELAAPAEPEPDSGGDVEEEEPSPGTSTSTSSARQPPTPSVSETGDPPPAPTTGSPSKRGRAGSTSAGSTDGSGPETTSPASSRGRK